MFVITSRSVPVFTNLCEDHRDRCPGVAAGELAVHGTVDEEVQHGWSGHRHR
jgi:hypothetical protein